MFVLFFVGQLLNLVFELLVMCSLVREQSLLSLNLKVGGNFEIITIHTALEGICSLAANISVMKEIATVRLSFLFLFFVSESTFIDFRFFYG